MADDVEVNDRRVSYIASSGQTVFDIDFPMDSQDEQDLSVYNNGSALTYTTDYTVDLDNLEVTLTSGASADDIIVIEGSAQIKREIAFTRNGSLRTSVLNSDFRRMFYILQEMSRDIERSVQLSKSASISITVTLPDPADGHVLVWDGDDGALGNGPSIVDIANAQTYAENASLSATTALNAQSAAESARDEAQASVGGVRVSANDTTPGNLEAKLLAGTGLSLSTQNDGGNETRTISPDIASQAEAEAGTATDKLMTPENTAQLIESILREKIYPVGSVYISETNSENPGVILGFGTWTAIEGKMLIGADGTYTAGSTGGSATTTQTTSTLAAHSHTINSLTRSYASSGINGSYLGSTGDTSTTVSAGSGNAMTTISPYHAFYIWRRTA